NTHEALAIPDADDEPAGLGERKIDVRRTPATRGLQRQRRTLDAAHSLSFAGCALASYADAPGFAPGTAEISHPNTCCFGWYSAATASRARRLCGASHIL